VGESHGLYIKKPFQIFVDGTLNICSEIQKKILKEYGDEIKSILEDISIEKDFVINTMEVDGDHIHLLINYNPNQSILSIVRLLKQISTYRIWRQNNNHLRLRKEFWVERTFWSDGYFACSIGNVSENIIRKYIEDQG